MTTSRQLIVIIVEHDGHYDVTKCIHTEQELEWFSTHNFGIADALMPHGIISEKDYDHFISRYGD